MVNGWHRLYLGPLLLALVLAACMSQGPTSAQKPTPSAQPSAAAVPGSSDFPTPTDYRTVCNLMGAICSCPPNADSTCTQSLPASVMRPLHLPTVAVGQPCPSTPQHQVKTADFGGYALGAGPVQPMVLGRFSVGPDGWSTFKTLWFTLPSYTDVVLIRGARIDGNGPVGFGEDKPVLGHLIIPPGPTLNGQDGYREAPGGTFIKSPGCYAFQVDGLNFSYAIVFSIRQTT
jgi:hypothetical protein